jgi:hypothetical protein
MQHLDTQRDRKLSKARLISEIDQLFGDVMVEVNLKDDFVEESAEEKEQLAKSKLLV